MRNESSMISGGINDSESKLSEKDYENDDLELDLLVKKGDH